MLQTPEYEAGVGKTVLIVDVKFSLEALFTL
jgi:hypothetical protein